MEFSTYIENFCVNAALEVFMKEHNNCGLTLKLVQVRNMALTGMNFIWQN